MNFNNIIKPLTRNIIRFLISALPTFFISISFLTYCTYNYSNFYSFPYIYHLYTIFSIEILLFIIFNLASKLNKFYISVFVHSIFIFLLVNYYCIVIIGLESWHEIINKELLVSYLTQITKLLKVIDVSITKIITILSFEFLIIFTLKYLSVIFTIKKYGFCNINIKSLVFYLISSIFVVSHATLILFNPGETKGLEKNYFRFLKENEIFENANEKERKIDEQEEIERKRYLSSIAHKSNSDNINIVLITGDSLRPDHMSLYGYKRNTTPNIENIVKNNEGVFLNNMRSVCGHTACGMRGLASSKYVDSFSKNPIDIYEILKKLGYKTSLFLGGDFLNFYNSNLIFRKTDLYFDGNEARKTNSYINSDEWIIEKSALIKKEDNPQFLQFHLMSTHILGDSSEKYKVFFPEKNCYKSEPSSASEIDTCINRYDNSILQFDFYVNKIIENLKENDLLKDSIIIISADHGEFLGEKGLFIHGKSFYEQVMKIPFILILPERLRKANTTFLKNIKKCSMPTSIVDIAPTVLSLIDIDSPKTWEGISIKDYCQQDRKTKYLQSEYSVEVFNKNKWLFKKVNDTQKNETFKFNLTLDPYENNKIQGITTIN